MGGEQGMSCSQVQNRQGLRRAADPHHEHKGEMVRDGRSSRQLAH